MHAYAMVVRDEAQLAKAVHELVDVRPGATDHVGKRLLRNGRQQRIVVFGARAISQDKEKAGETLFSTVEHLVDEGRLCLECAFQQKCQRCKKTALFA